MATTRTMNFYGYGYGSIPVNVQVTLNGTEIFSGEIPTLDQVSVYTHPEDQTLIFSTQIPMDFAGNANVAVTVNNGYVWNEYIKINYGTKYNPKYSSEQLAILENPNTTQNERVAIYETAAEPPFSAEEITLLQSTNPADSAAKTAVLVAHGATIMVSTGADEFVFPSAPDYRPVVYVDGVEQLIPEPRLYPGTYAWGIYSGQVFSGNIIIGPGLQ
jgi:hypothetical protein